MRPTALLEHEHGVIELVLTCLEAMADRCEAEQPLDVALAEQALDFFRSYADQWHHKKEEDLLFPMMETKGLSRESGPTGVMIHEHEEGRRTIQAMADALARMRSSTPGAQADFVENARGYVHLLREHIDKENHCLFPMAEQALTPADQEQLAASFDQAERESPDSAAEQRYVALAKRLASELGVEHARIDAV